jgi:hypothetical protein
MRLMTRSIWNSRLDLTDVLPDAQPGEIVAQGTGTVDVYATCSTDVSIVGRSVRDRLHEMHIAENGLACLRLKLVDGDRLKVHPGTCQWEESLDDVWETSCGRIFSLTDGSPAENDMRFCYHCGKTLVVVKTGEQP